jgi:hypothetical protein
MDEEKIKRLLQVDLQVWFLANQPKLTTEIANSQAVLPSVVFLISPTLAGQAAPQQCNSFEILAFSVGAKSVVFSNSTNNQMSSGHMKIRLLVEDVTPLSFAGSCPSSGVLPPLLGSLPPLTLSGSAGETAVKTLACS